MAGEILRVVAAYRVIALSEVMEEKRENEVAEIKIKRGSLRNGWLVFFGLLLFLFVGGGGFAYYKIDELNAFARLKISDYARQYLDADVAFGTLSWRPVAGISVRGISISRDGRTLLSAERLSASLSISSIFGASPRLSRLSANGIKTTVEDVLSLVPEMERNPEDPLNIPIDLIFVTESEIETPYGIVAVERGALRIDNSEIFDADIKLSVNGVEVTVDGVAANSRGTWRADGLRVKTGDGSAELYGELYPSQDVKFSLKKFDISAAEKIAPQIGDFGVSGLLSGNGSAALRDGQLISSGEGMLNNVVAHGLPLDGVAVKWDVSPELIKAEINQGKVFDSELNGIFELDLTHPDKYLKLSASAKNLKFDDWASRIANSAAELASGRISSLSADIEGPLNALKGRVDLGSSQVGYKEIVLNDMRGTALFDGKPAGRLDISATLDGRPLSLAGTLSLGDEIPTNLSFSVGGISLDKALKSFPQTENLKADGTLALSGSCTGFFGKWVVALDVLSESLKIDPLGEISSIGAKASYSMETGQLLLNKASAQWNGISATAEGRFAANEAEPLDFKGTFKNADLTRLYTLLPVLKLLNIAGMASGEWNVAGAIASPVITATARTGAARFRTLKLDKFTTGVHYSGHTLKLEPMTAFTGGGVGNLSCDISLPHKDEKGNALPVSWSLSGDLSKVDFSVINGLLNANEDISGEVSGKVTAGDSGDGLHWSLDFSGKKLAWREFRADTLSGLIIGDPKEITIEKSEGTFLKGETTGTGRIAMPKDEQPFSECAIEIRAGIKKMNLYELTRRHLPFVRSVQGLLEGNVVVAGTVGSPRFDAKTRVAPFRYRGLMLPMIEVNINGTMSEIKITEAKALLRDGNLGARGRFWAEDGAWHGDFKIDGKDIEIRQIGGYLPESVRSRLAGKADFKMEGAGPLVEISGSGSIASKELTLMGIEFQDIDAPFFISKQVMMVEDLNAKTNGGTLTGGAGFNFNDNRWGANFTLKGAELKSLISQALPDMSGEISGTGDLIIRGGAESGRLSTLRYGGALSLTNGEISGFDFVEQAKKFTSGKPLRYQTLQASFSYADGIFTLLPGSQAVAPSDDTVYRNIMVDGMMNGEKELSFFVLGKINIRALNSMLGGFQGLVNATEMNSGEFDKDEALQKVLGGVVTGFTRNEFRFVSLGVGGTINEPELKNLRVSQAENMRSSRSLIPTKGGDPEDEDTKDGNTTVRFKFEIPVGPGTGTRGGFNSGDFVGQTLENLINNIDFGL